MGLPPAACRICDKDRDRSVHCLLLMRRCLTQIVLLVVARLAEA